MELYIKGMIIKYALIIAIIVYIFDSPFFFLIELIIPIINVNGVMNIVISPKSAINPNIAPKLKSSYLFKCYFNSI